MGRPKKKAEDLKIRFSTRLYQKDIDTIISVSGKNITEKLEKILDFYRQNCTDKSD